MAREIVRANKPRTQLQMVLMEYGDESRSKLKNSGWDFARGVKRERMEIMAEILCYCNHEKNKTDIMYKANLNYVQLKKYLKLLTAQGLLVVDSNKYVTTQKGYRFLKLLAQLNDMLDS